MKNQTKVIVAGMIGNALEAYDYMLYGVFAVIIAKHFFPATDPRAALLASLAAFAAGFVMRPFGGILFGHIGDKYGRKKALTLSILLMAVPTFIIGTLPSYSQVGIFAPIMLVLCRLLQGLCAAGEYSGAAIFVIEHNGKSRAGYAGSLIVSSSIIGALTAMALGAFALSPGMPEWAWRALFMFGIVVGAAGFYVRQKIDESPEYKKMAAAKIIVKSPLKEAIFNSPRAVLSVVIIGGVAGALSYSLITYMNVYLQKVVGLAVNHSMLFNIVGLLVFMFATPFVGRIADKLSPSRVLSYGAWAVILGIYPVYFLLQSPEPGNILKAQVLLGLICACFTAPVNAFMNELFPPRFRYSGVSFSYNLGMALLGGTMPVASTLFIQWTGSPMAPAFYTMAGGALTLFAVYLGKTALIQSKPKAGKDIDLDLKERAA